VDEPTIRVIAAAVQAPSARNQQSWVFCVFRDAAAVVFCHSSNARHTQQQLVLMQIKVTGGERR
jgi:hypothetical protein